MKFSWVLLLVVLCAVFSEGVMVRSRKAGEEKFPEPNAAGQAPPVDGQAPPADGQAPPADGQAPPADGQAAPLPPATVEKLDEQEANSATKPETFDASKTGSAEAAAESTTEVKVVTTEESSSSDEASSEEESSGEKKGEKECKPFIAYGEALLKRANELLKEDNNDAKQITEEEFLKKITEEDGSDECYKDHYELVAVPDADADETSKEEKKEEEILLQEEEKEPLAELSSVLVFKDENIPKTEKKYAIAVLKGVCEKEARTTELNLLQTKAADAAKAKKEESFGSDEESSEESSSEETTEERVEHVEHEEAVETKTHTVHEEEDNDESEASEDKKAEVAHVEVQISTEDAHDELAELLSASYHASAEDKFKFLYLDDGYVSITECITQAELPEWLGGEDTVTLEGVYLPKENDENDDKEEEEKEQSELKGLIA